MPHQNSPSRRRSTKVLALGLTLIALLLTPLIGRSDSASVNSAEFVIHVTDAALGILRSNEITPDEQRRRLKLLLEKYFAMDRIGQFVVGAYWRRMSSSQQSRFQELFKEWVVRFYSYKMSRYADVTLTVGRITQLPNGDELVTTQIGGPKVQPPLSLKWRVRHHSRGARIFDVIVEGVSMALVQKSDFTTVLNNHGIEALLDSLEARLVAATQPPAETAKVQ